MGTAGEGIQAGLSAQIQGLTACWVLDIHSFKNRKWIGIQNGNVRNSLCINSNLCRHLRHSLITEIDLIHKCMLSHFQTHCKLLWTPEIKEHKAETKLEHKLLWKENFGLPTLLYLYIKVVNWKWVIHIY